MANTYLGIGTNLGDKETNLRTAVNYIKEQIGHVTALSTFYTTKPWGFQSPNLFMNAALCVHTSLTPYALLAQTQAIEQKMGRTAQSKSTDGNYSDRIIDIDILLYDNWIVEGNNLVIPHPYMHERRFVLEPLAEIAPNVVHPVLRKTINELFYL